MGTLLLSGIETSIRQILVSNLLDYRNPIILVDLYLRRERPIKVHLHEHLKGAMS